jgi:putative phage-type endonuclease
MQTHNLQQGSKLWHDFRSDHFGASEAAAALGISPYISRTELLELKSRGIEKDHSEFTKAIFQKGHDAEEFARKLLDAQGLDFYPVTCSEGKLSASCDGLTIDNSLAFEHKLYSDDLAEKVQSGVIPDYYMAQCQQVLMVTGADKLIFVCSDGTSTNWAETEVFPDQSWFTRIQSAWQQFEKDLETYKPKELADKPEAAAIMQLPALSIQIKGEVTVSNLPQFKEAAETFIANIRTELKTDEDFVNAEETVKFCDETEKKLESAKAAAIGQTASIDELMRTIDFIKESIRTKRLTLEKLVKTQKESIKTKIIDNAYKLCVEHQTNIASEFKNISFAALASLSRQNFETACKSKRTLASLHNAVDTEVAAIKIKLDDLARVIRKNLTHLPDDLSLFRDLQSIITKPEDDFKLLVEYRLDEQKRKEAQKIRDDEIAEAKAKEELKQPEPQPVSLDIKQTEPEDARIADKKHRKSIIDDAISTLMVEAAIPDVTAEAIINLIVQGKIKHVSIKF